MYLPDKGRKSVEFDIKGKQESIHVKGKNQLRSDRDLKKELRYHGSPVQFILAYLSIPSLIDNAFSRLSIKRRQKCGFVAAFLL